MFFWLPIFFLLVSSDPAPEWLPNALLELYSDCDLSEFVPRGALKAEIYATYPGTNGFYGCVKYNVDLKNESFTQDDKPVCSQKVEFANVKSNLFFHPGLESAASLQVILHEGNLTKTQLSFGDEVWLVLPHATYTSARQIIVTPEWLDIVFSDDDVNRMFTPKNKTAAGKLPGDLKYSYRQDTDTLYGLSETNGILGCVQWNEYTTINELSPTLQKPCMEDMCFLRHPPRNSTVDFASLIYAKPECRSNYWEQAQNLSSAFIRFIGPEVIVNTTDPPCPPPPPTTTTTEAIIETTTESYEDEEYEEPPADEGSKPGMLIFYILISILAFLILVALVVVALWVYRRKKMGKGKKHDKKKDKPEPAKAHTNDGSGRGSQKGSGSGKVSDSAKRSAGKKGSDSAKKSGSGKKSVSGKGPDKAKGSGSAKGSSSTKDSDQEEPVPAKMLATTTEEEKRTLHEIPQDTIAESLGDEKKQNKLFDLNEVEGIEAELPYKPLEGPPKPDDGVYVVFKKVGITLPGGIFEATFGKIEFMLGQEDCTLFYEYVGYGLSRIETASMAMRKGQKYQKHGTIPDVIATSLLPHIGVRVMVVKRLGRPLKGVSLLGKLSFQQRMNLVSETLMCMEDLLRAEIVHRDIKPACFQHKEGDSKIHITHLGLARFHTSTPRAKVPFFGNPAYTSLASHKEMERTHYDDMTSWMYIILTAFNKKLVPWRKETDRASIFEQKTKLLDKKFFEQQLDKYVPSPTPKLFLSQLNDLIQQLPSMKDTSYTEIRELVYRFMPQEVKG